MVTVIVWLAPSCFNNQCKVQKQWPFPMVICEVKIFENTIAFIKTMLVLWACAAKVGKQAESLLLTLFDWIIL